MNARNRQLDFMKVVAALAVVCLHVSAEVVTKAPDVASSSWQIGNLIDSYSRWCVPVFVMISGALLLTNPNGQTAIEFYKKRLNRLLTPLIFWSLFYIILTARLNNDFSIEDALHRIKTGKPYFHLWYLYMLFGLYIITPLLRIIIQVSSRSDRFVHMIFWFMIAFTYSIYVTFETIFIAYTVSYIGYFLAGNYLSNIQTEINRKLLMLGAMVSGFIISYMVSYLYADLGRYSWELMYNYANPLVVMMSICIFIILSNVRIESVWISKLSMVTFGIYLIHPFWMVLLNKFGINGFLYHPALGIFLATMAVFILSAVSSSWLLRVPLLRKLIC